MALRDFEDGEGRIWRAWDVPGPRIFKPARAVASRRVKVMPGYEPERRVQPDRRTRPNLDQGWVCFECTAGEKRRLAPPPPDWSALSDAELRELCRQGTPIGAQR